MTTSGAPEGRTSSGAPSSELHATATRIRQRRRGDARCIRLVSAAMSGRQIAWTVLERGHDIVAADGNKLGTVKEVVGDRDKDIFSGVTYSPGLTQPDLFVPAGSISQITDRGVLLTLDGDAAAALDPYEG
ncbi:MAG: DUF2171 domain-containing protein [Actinobacteria bacterium]|nr:DUF2171 domain-containing protein [Actinomycetota bacterium]